MYITCPALGLWVCTASSVEMSVLDIQQGAALLRQGSHCATAQWPVAASCRVLSASVFMTDCSIKHV